MEQLENAFAESAVLPRHHYGFSLYDLDSNRTVYEHQSDYYFTPASNTKIYTLYVSLHTLGDSIPGLQYVERGDSLIFWGTGDPTFLHPTLDNGRVYNFLKNSDKKLYYRRQDNPEGSFRRGWAMSAYNSAYQRDIAPFPIYSNLVELTVNDGRLEASPSYFNQTIQPLTITKDRFYVQRQIGDNTFRLFGQRTPAQYATKKPFVWSDSLFVTLLADTLARTVNLLEDGTELEQNENIHTLYSVPRNLLLREMMLPSDNFLAEQLTMVAAYSKYGAFSTDSLREEFSQSDFSRFVGGADLWDGSGLSRYNQITPSNVVNLLIALRQEVGDEYTLRMFFPAGGVDGTLKNAYRVGESGPFVWAKTGTLRSVYCQSGYIKTKSGRHFAFSFLNNHFRGSATPVRQEIGRIVTFIYNNY